MCIFVSRTFCSNKLDVQETDGSLKQFHRVRGNFFGRWLVVDYSVSYVDRKWHVRQRFDLNGFQLMCLRIWKTVNAGDVKRQWSSAHGLRMVSCEQQFGLAV